MTFPKSSPFFQPPAVGRITQLTEHSETPLVMINTLQVELDDLYTWLQGQRGAGITDQDEFLQELSDRIYRLLR